MTPHFLGPDAALIDEVGDPRPWFRVQRERLKRDLMADPTWLRGRIVRLSARLAEEGVERAPVVVEPDSAAALREEMQRLERAIGAAMAFREMPEVVMGLDEPGVGEALAAE
ncbi:hypothetical protein [Sorangium sp. So ce1024]|uniref:hypothetical protein n=1 Tax=Sorangium sp. So ce1024 TaxID=3133327 RepID=UPI003F0C99E3